MAGHRGGGCIPAGGATTSSQTALEECPVLRRFVVTLDRHDEPPTLIALYWPDPDGRTAGAAELEFFSFCRAAGCLPVLWACAHRVRYPAGE